MKSKTLCQGVFYVSRTSFLEGTVNVEGKDPILVQGLEAMNRKANPGNLFFQGYIFTTINYLFTTI